MEPESLREVITDNIKERYDDLSEDNQYLPWSLPVKETYGKIIGYEEKVLKYRIEKHKVPNIVYEYEEYWDYVWEKVSDDPYDDTKVRKKVKKIRIKSRKQVGFTVHDQVIRDPHGPFEKTFKFPKYDSAQVAERYDGWHGTVALTYYSMIKCGLPVSDLKLRKGWLFLLITFVSMVILTGHGICQWYVNYSQQFIRRVKSILKLPDIRRPS